MKKAKWMIVALMMACLLAGCAEMNQTTKASSSPVMDRIVSRGELRVGVSGDMPPMNLLTKDDKVIGMDVDLATMIAEAMGVRLNVQRIDFKGLLPALESGSIDLIVSNMTMTPDRNLKVAFVGPYFTSGKAFLTKRSSIAQAKGLPDVNNPQYTFAALKGSTSEAVISTGKPGIHKAARPRRLGHRKAGSTSSTPSPLTAPGHSRTLNSSRSSPNR